MGRQPAIVGGVVGLPLLAVGIWLAEFQSQYSPSLSIPFLALGVGILIAGGLIQVVTRDRPTLREEEALLETRHPTRRRAAMRVGIGFPLFGVAVYLLFWSSVPYVYPTVTFVGGLYLLTTGLYTYWDRAATAYYLTTKRAIDTRQFPWPVRNEVELGDTATTPSTETIHETLAVLNQEQAGESEEIPTPLDAETARIVIEDVRSTIATNETLGARATAELSNVVDTLGNRIDSKSPSNSRVSADVERRFIQAATHATQLAIRASEAAEDRSAVRKQLSQGSEIAAGLATVLNDGTAHFGDIEEDLLLGIAHANRLERTVLNDGTAHFGDLEQDLLLGIVHANRIESRVREQQNDRITELLATATMAYQDGEKLIAESDYARAESRASEGIEASDEATDLDRVFELQRGPEIAEKQENLESLRERADQLSDLTKRADDRETTIRRAIKSRTYGEAEAALDELEQRIGELEANGAATQTVATLRSDAQELRETIADRRAASPINDLLESVRPARTRTEFLLDEGEYERATRRLEPAIETLEEVREIAQGHDFSGDKDIPETLRGIESLRGETKRGPGKELDELLEVAEEHVSLGFDETDAGQSYAAVEAFELARQEYETALRLCKRWELAERWDIEQRRSTVEEHLEFAREKRDEQQWIARRNLNCTLDEAALVRGDQYEEIDQFIEARGAPAESISSLNKTTHLSGRATDSGLPTDRYEDVDHSDAIHTNLATETEDGDHRSRDLIESLQVLATKLGEPPRPEFVTAYGTYSADVYLETFGSWPEALAAANLEPIDESARERRTYSRVEILDAVVDVASQLGHAPSKSEMTEHGELSAPTVQSRFDDWETALELAEVADGVDNSLEKTDEGARAEGSAQESTDSVDGEGDILDQIESEFAKLGSSKEPEEP